MITTKQAKHIESILSPEAATLLSALGQAMILPQIPEGMPAEFYQGFALAILLTYPLVSSDPAKTMAWAMLGSAAAVRYQDALPLQLPENGEAQQ